jgi:HK97 family phage prohead protease
MRAGDAPTADRPRPPHVHPGNVFQLNAPEEILRGGSGSGNVPTRVSRAEAMSVGAVKRARDLICGTLGTLPFRAYDEHRRPVWSELLDQPEEDIASSVTWTSVFEDMLFEGRSWLRIVGFERLGGDLYPSKVRRLEPRSVLVQTNAKVYVNEEGRPQGLANEVVPDHLLIRIDSPNEGLLTAAARSIRMAILLDRTAERYANEPLPLGYFSPADGQGDQPPEEIQKILDEWEASRQERAWGYVGAALKAQALQWNPEQLQLADARDYAVLDIARHAGVDPEDLGVSTTSRTYANSEQRRLDLVDFTCAAYVSGVENRLRMRDVMPPRHRVRAQYNGFLRSDTKTRMETYKLGREVGVYNDERIAEMEDIPSATPPEPVRNDARQLAEIVQKIYLGVPGVLSDDEAREILNRAGANLRPRPQTPAAPAAPAAPVEEKPVRQHTTAAAVRFDTDQDGGQTFTFTVDPETAAFAVDTAKRTITGLAVPWGQIARSGYAKWKFAPESLAWSDTSRVKMLRDHDFTQPLGRALSLQSTDVGLMATFQIGRGDEGDKALQSAEDGVLDGLSIGVWFDGIADEWQPDPADESVRLVRRATLREISLTAMPSFDTARVTAVTASLAAPATEKSLEKETVTMTAPTEQQQPAAPPVAPAAQPAGATQTVQASAPVTGTDFATFTAGLPAALATAMGEVLEKLPFMQQHQAVEEGRKVIPAGRAVVTREAPVYSMNGLGFSLVRDSWRAHRDRDPEAVDRLRKFEAQTAGMAEECAAVAFAAANTTNAAAVIPPGYRPDLYVTQLMKGRPLVGGVSKGNLADATPFTIPSFTSSSGLASQHTEGTNPTVGTVTLATVTVTPRAYSGLFQITREIADSSNPAIDAIAMQAMGEAYSQQTEAVVYTELNGANGAGGTITSGLVPSGAQASTTTGQGDELIAGIRTAEALYYFRRFAGIDRGYLSQEGTTGLATAVDTTGRPLIPFEMGQNAFGQGGGVNGGYQIDGVLFTPCWSMTGNAAGDSDVLMFNSADVWAWESPLLTFRYEERSGPANIDLALFGYFATRVIRPVGVAGVRHTAA